MWQITDQSLLCIAHFILILFPIPVSVSNSLLSSTALVRTDQYLRWLCKVEFTQFVISMVLMLYLQGQMIATSQGSSKFSSTARRLLGAVYWTSM